MENILLMVRKRMQMLEGLQDENIKSWLLCQYPSDLAFRLDNDEVWARMGPCCRLQTWKDKKKDSVVLPFCYRFVAADYEKREVRRASY